MRRIGVLLVLLSAEILSAQSLSVERARKLVGEKAELAYVAGSVNSPDFCVFNKVADKGFVIVSPDDVFGDGIVLAYSDEGTFDYEALPENAKWVLSQYQEQIKYLRDNNIKMASGASSIVGRVIVAPLLADAHWNQSYPFNDLCPVDGREKSVTGCVATAMAQIMWYYKWPLSGTGTHSYKWNNKTLSVDYSKSVYDWSRMPGKYIRGQYGTAEVQAVSRLMYDCGVAVEMEYSAYGSGAYSFDVPNALKNYFKYKSATYSYRYGASSSNWNTRMKSELNSRRPLFMGGQSSDGGHAFVCDGYDSNDYFHYNFGWGGSGNGYYLSTVAGGFSQGQEMVYEIRPDREKLLYDGVYYNQLCDDKVEVSYPDADDEYYSDRIVVPSKIGDDSLAYNVVAIGAYAFASSDVSVIDIPASVSSIAGNSMFGCENLDTIYVHWKEPLDCDISIFNNAVYSNAVLVVPDGRVDTYSKCMPWSLFSTIVDESGSTEVAGWSEWELTNGRCGAYKYSWTAMAPESEDVVVYKRTSTTFQPKVQYKVENWFSTSLIIDVDTLSGQCQIAKQSTGIINTDDEILVSDYPNYNRQYSYKSYPCTFDNELGIISMNLVYSSSAGGYYHMGRDSLFISGYPVYDISLGKVSVDEFGKVSCAVDYSSDAAGYGYVFLPGKLSSGQLPSAYNDIKSGKIELEYAVEKNLTSQLTESDAYTLVVVSMDDNFRLHEFAYAHLSYMANEPDWVDVYVGSYYYQAWKKMTQNDVHLLHDMNNPRYWKLSPMYNDSELVFRWYDDDTLEFDEQPSGFTNSSVRVNIFDNKYSDKAQKKGSYYDSSRNTLYFDTYYSSTITKYAVEAFVKEVPTAIGEINADTDTETLIYNIYGHKLDAPQKGLNIINGQKVYIE